MEHQMSHDVKQTVARNLVNGIENLIEEAQTDTRPLEVDPYRSRLFEFFVTADGAELIADDKQMPVHNEFAADADDTDLSADGLCRLLAQRFGLDMVARESAAQQSKMPPEHLERMRLLWSVMRMWMEWTYAWQRWDEFHGESEDG